MIGGKQFSLGILPYHARVGLDPCMETLAKGMYCCSILDSLEELKEILKESNMIPCDVVYYQGGRHLCI